MEGRGRGGVGGVEGVGGGDVEPVGVGVAGGYSSKTAFRLNDSTRESQGGKTMAGAQKVEAADVLTVDVISVFTIPTVALPAAASVSLQVGLCAVCFTTLPC